MFTFKAAFTSLVVTPISYVLHPFIGHVTLEPNGQEKQPKLNHSVPEPAQAGKKLKSNPVVVAPEPKPQAKKTTSTRSVPQPKRQAKNLKSKLPASKPQRAIPKLSQMAPAPKREGKKVESKAKRSTGGPELERHIPWPAVSRCPPSSPSLKRSSFIAQDLHPSCLQYRRSLPLAAHDPRTYNRRIWKLSRHVRND